MVPSFSDGTIYGAKVLHRHNNGKIANLNKSRKMGGGGGGEEILIQLL